MKRPNARRLLESLRNARQQVQAQCQQVTQAAAHEPVNENLHKWFKEKWVRFGPDGKIRGDCARGSDSEGKPKCLPQSKAHALGKKGRASAAAKKRREDPNPERRGAAINVATKKKTSESKLDEKCWDTHRQAGMKRKGDRMVPNCVPRESKEQCPECGGEMYPDSMILEKQDACYYKVKSRYKVWPSAYASGALVQCRKKGAKNWGKKTEGVVEGMSWSALDEGLSVEDKIIIFEEYMTNGNLTESLEHDKRDYFISLFKMSSTPAKDKTYIVVPLSLVGNKIMPLDAPAIMKFVGHGHDGLVFNSPNGEKTYPSKIMRDLSVFNTFTFRSQSLYDKFRTALSLKFNVSLPLVGQGKHGVAEGSNDWSGPLYDPALQGNGKKQRYEMMFKNGQVKRFSAMNDNEARKIAAGHGAKSVIRMKGNVPGDKIKEQGVAEGSPQSLGTALRNTLSRVEPGSKLDKKIRHHNDMVRRFGAEAGTMTSAPDGYHIDKKGFVRLGEGVTEGLEKITEHRDRMYQYLKSIVPGFPDYVVKDWLYANFARGATRGPGWSFDTIGKDIPNILKDMGLSVNTKWQLVPNMKFTMDMWEPKTLKRLQARAGGSSKSTDPDVHIPARDAERHATQAALAQQQGGVRKEPVILIKTSQGYELLEGWHRTIQHFAKYPQGYTGPAYVAVAQGQQGVAESFDQPYPMSWEKGDFGDVDALAQLDDGTYLHVMFNLADRSENDWGVEFYRGDSQSVTGQGDAQRVFATVLAAIGQFVKKQKPDRLFFTAVKEEDSTGSRAKLYDRLVQKYATGLGYELQKVDYPQQTGYKLTRKEQKTSQANKTKQPAVAEGTRQQLDFDSLYGKVFKITDNNGNPNNPGFSIVTPLNGDSWNWKERPEFKKIVKQKLNDPNFLGDHKYQQIIDAMLGNKFDSSKHVVKGVAEDQLAEKWSQKYKKSINCNNPRGFSQRAHCAGRKKNEAANPAQQAAIAIAMKQAGKKPKQAVGEAHINQQMALYKPDGTTYRGQEMPTLDPEDPAHKAVRFGPEHEQSYEQDFDKQELKRLATRAIDSLPKIQRVVLIMRLWHDLTLEQIGKRLGLSKARIRQIERQALIKISRDDDILRDLHTFAQESHVKSPAVLEADDDDAVASNAALISGPGTTDTVSPKPTATPMAAPTAQPTATAATPMAAPTATAQPKPVATAAIASTASTPMAAPTATAQLKPTATPTGSADIMALQNKLIAAGEKIKADGIMGPRTQAALSRYNARPTPAPVATAQPKPAVSTPAPATAQPAAPTNAVQSGSGTPIRTGSGGYVVSPDSTPAANTATTDTTPAASSYDHNLMLAAIKHRESGGDPNAVSRVGAVGTMQTMPNTLKNPGYGVKPARDNSPQELERVGKDYYAAMLKTYKDPKVALAAYNWGPGNVNKWLNKGGDFAKLPGETRAYVKNIMGDYQAAQAAQATKMASGTRPAVSETRGKDQDQFGGMHQDDFQAKLQRLKQLVQAGPLKTVRDPLTGRTRNVPVKPKQP